MPKIWMKRRCAKEAPNCGNDKGAVTIPRCFVEGTIKAVRAGRFNPRDGEKSALYVVGCELSTQRLLLL